MKTVATQFGISFNADFEENLWAFLMKDKYIVRAGEFAIVDKPVYDSLINAVIVLQSHIDKLILSTPTGEERDKLTVLNIVALDALRKAKEDEK